MENFDSIDELKAVVYEASGIWDCLSRNTSDVALDWGELHGTQKL